MFNRDEAKIKIHAKQPTPDSLCSYKYIWIERKLYSKIWPCSCRTKRELRTMKKKYIIHRKWRRDTHKKTLFCMFFIIIFDISDVIKVTGTDFMVTYYSLFISVNWCKWFQTYNVVIKPIGSIEHIALCQIIKFTSFVSHLSVLHKFWQKKII